MATDALADGFQETFWIDADVEFHPDAVDRMRRHGLPITSGICARKGVRAIASQPLPGTKQITMGQGGGLVEILYAGGGFLLVLREVYLAVQERLALPMCNERFGRPMVPYFLPMVIECGGDLKSPLPVDGNGHHARMVGVPQDAQHNFGPPSPPDPLRRYPALPKGEGSNNAAPNTSAPSPVPNAAEGDWKSPLRDGAAIRLTQESAIPLYDRQPPRKSPLRTCSLDCRREDRLS